MCEVDAASRKYCRLQKILSLLNGVIYKLGIYSGFLTRYYIARI
jgi:hypothetical protein